MWRTWRTRLALRVIGLVAFLLPVAISAQGIVWPTRFTTGGRDIVNMTFAGTQVGELPVGLKLLSGTVDVVDMGGVHMLRASSESELELPLPENLPQDFSVEFEFIPKQCCNPQDLAIEGTSVGHSNSGSSQITWHRNRVTVIGGGDSYASEMPDVLANSTPGTPTVVQVVMEGTTLKLYTNGRRLYTLTDRKFVRARKLWIYLGGQDDGKYAVYVSRIRVTSNAPPAGPLNAGNAPSASSGGSTSNSPGGAAAGSGAPGGGAPGSGGPTPNNPSSGSQPPTAPPSSNPPTSSSGAAPGPLKTNAAFFGGGLVANVVVWSPVPNAVSYIVYRREPAVSGSPFQSAWYFVLKTQYIQTSGLNTMLGGDIGGFDPYVPRNTAFEYSVRAVLADGSVTLPGPTVTVPAATEPATAPANLSVNVSPPQVLTSLGGRSGSVVTWTWDGDPGQFGFGIALDTYDLNRVPQMVREYHAVPNAPMGTSPAPVKYSREIPQGHTVAFCVSPWPTNHPNDPVGLLSVPTAAGRFTLPPFSCILSQVP